MKIQELLPDPSDGPDTDLTALRAEAEQRTDCDIADARQPRSCEVMWPADPASWCVGCLIRRLLAALPTGAAAMTERDTPDLTEIPTMNEYGMAPKRRWRDWLFPQTYIGWRGESESRTYITSTMYVKVSWSDRLRLLVSGKVRVEIRTYTDVEVKQADTDSAFSVMAP